MSDKCKEKYGYDWGKERDELTRKHFKKIEFGMLKHINGKEFRRCFLVSSLGMIGIVFPESYVGNKLFLFRILKDNSLEYDCSYASITDLIDDGWAID